MPRINAFEENDYYYPAPRQSDPTFDDAYRRQPAVRTRSRSRPAGSRTPAFLRNDERRVEAGPMVLRQRDVETYDRHRPSSSDSQRAQDQRMALRLGGDYDDRDPRGRYDDRDRSRYDERDRIHARVVDRRRSSDSLSDSLSDETSSIAASSEATSPPPPRHIRGPTVEREVITHYRNVDHGTVHARPPSPPPAPRPAVRPYVTATRGRQTDIDVVLNTDGDVDLDLDVRSRSRSRHRLARQPSNGRLVVGGPNRSHSRHHRRARSAAPAYPPVADEAARIAGAIDSRGRMGEAYGGATRDWTIVDVPPGTERVRMTGAGGGATDTAWSKYSGVRRTQFVPGPGSSGSNLLAPAPAPHRSRRKSLGARDRDRELEVQIDIDRRRSRTPQPPVRDNMWTELSKDLVNREAIERLGYEYEDAPGRYYVMMYLQYVSAATWKESWREI